MTESSNTRKREFEVVVWGATGFTGRLVAGYLAEHYGVGKDLRWAIGGRSESRLKEIRASLGKAAAKLPMIVADSHDAESLKELVKRTAVVCSTVGPFAKYGSELVAACADWGFFQVVNHGIDALSSSLRLIGTKLLLDGIALAGGHSIDSPEPIFGLAVTGQVAKAHLKQNNTAAAGCLLYLTKPLGVVVLTTAQKQKKLRPEHDGLAIKTMCRLNSVGAKLGPMPGVKAVTA